MNAEKRRKVWKRKRKDLQELSDCTKRLERCERMKACREIELVGKMKEYGEATERKEENGE